MAIRSCFVPRPVGNPRKTVQAARCQGRTIHRLAQANIYALLALPRCTRFLSRETPVGRAESLFARQDPPEAFRECAGNWAREPRVGMAIAARSTRNPISEGSHGQPIESRGCRLFRGPLLPSWTAFTCICRYPRPPAVSLQLFLVSVRLQDPVQRRDRLLGRRGRAPDEEDCCNRRTCPVPVKRGLRNARPPIPRSECPWRAPVVSRGSSGRRQGVIQPDHRALVFADRGDQRFDQLVLVRSTCWMTGRSAFRTLEGPASIGRSSSTTACVRRRLGSSLRNSAVASAGPANTSRSKAYSVKSRSVSRATHFRCHRCACPRCVETVGATTASRFRHSSRDGHP